VKLDGKPRDAKQLEFLTLHGYDVRVLWEDDLKKDHIGCMEMIL